MSKHKIRFACIAFSLLLLVTGCATSSSLENKTYLRPTDFLAYPPVNIVLSVDDIPDDRILRFQYGQRVGLQNKILTSLYKSGAFSRLLPENGEGRYSLEIRYRHKLLSSEHAHAAKMILSAFTLFLIPVSKTVEQTFDVTVKDGATTIKEFSYRDVSDVYDHISRTPASIEYERIDNLVAHFLIDLDKSDIIER